MKFLSLFKGNKGENNKEEDGVKTLVEATGGLKIQLNEESAVFGAALKHSEVPFSPNWRLAPLLADAVLGDRKSLIKLCAGAMALGFMVSLVVFKITGFPLPFPHMRQSLISSAKPSVSTAVVTHSDVTPTSTASVETPEMKAERDKIFEEIDFNLSIQDKDGFDWDILKLEEDIRQHIANDGNLQKSGFLQDEAKKLTARINNAIDSYHKIRKPDKQYARDLEHLLEIEKKRVAYLSAALAIGAAGGDYSDSLRNAADSYQEYLAANREFERKKNADE